MDSDTSLTAMNRAVCQRAATLDPANETYSCERAEQGGFYYLSVSVNDGQVTWSLHRHHSGTMKLQGVIKWDIPGSEQPSCYSGEWTDTDLEILGRMLRYVYPARSRGQDL